MNEALILGSVRQHELTEAAERMNARLREEISQRQRAEEALRESEERFRALFDSAPMAAVACDRHGVIQHYNARAIELWGREPRRRSELHCGSIRLWNSVGTLLPHAQSPMAEVLRTGHAAQDVELSIERPDGSRVPVLVSCAALQDRAGETTGAIASFIDLTERKKLEQQSLRAQRLESIGTLAGGIAHDLNNSLGPIMMSLDLLRAKLSDAPSLDLLATIDSSAQRGADMVRQILAFARGAESQRSVVRVEQLVGEVEKIVRETFLRQVQLHTLVPPGLWTVLGDSTQLHQVLLNLCLNARDAMPTGGVLLVSAENRQIDTHDLVLRQNPKHQPGPYVLLEVIDNGSGMKPEIAESIFDPFFTTKDFGKGSGLGLSTSLAIIKSHGGFLQVASEVGKGTTFQVFLPAQLETVLTAVQPPAVERPRGHGELILVVDDEEPIRHIAQQTLESFGYRVVLACDGAEAVDLYVKLGAEIAAVVTDMTMPVMEGPEAIRLMRAIDSRLPIIGASGLASTTYSAELASLGVQHVLMKPYGTAELLKTVKDALEERGPGGGLAS